MEERVLEIISQVSKRSVIDLKNQSTEKGLWDSLNHVELIIAIETEFNVYFEQEEIGQMNTPAKVIELLRSKV